MRFLSALTVAVMATSVLAAPMWNPEEFGKGIMETEQEVSKLTQAQPRPMVGNRPPPLITPQPEHGLQPHYAPTREGWEQVPDAPRRGPSMSERIRGDASRPSKWNPQTLAKIQKAIGKKPNWKTTLTLAMEKSKQEKAAAQAGRGGSINDEEMVDLEKGQGSGHGWPYHPGNQP